MKILRSEQYGLTLRIIFGKYALLKRCVEDFWRKINLNKTTVTRGIWFITNKDKLLKDLLDLL